MGPRKMKHLENRGKSLKTLRFLRRNALRRDRLNRSTGVDQGEARLMSLTHLSHVGRSSVILSGTERALLAIRQKNFDEIPNSLAR